MKINLHSKQPSLGSWVTIGHPNVIDIMAKAPLDWLVIDMEHTSIGLETCQTLISLIQGHGKAALVRVPENEPVIIKKVLDCGADGIVVPMVNSKQDAEKAVSAAYYPPNGTRGVGLYRAQNYGVGFEEYKQKLANKEIIIIAQIEHIDAVYNLEDILSVKDIDGYIIGPYDLSGSMGYPGDYDRDDVKDALNRVKKVCKQNNKSLGFHVISSKAEALQEKIDEGYNFLAFSLDFFFLGDRLREEIAKIKN